MSLITISPKTPMQFYRVPSDIINAESLRKMVGRTLSSETVALVNAMLNAFVHAVAVQTVEIANAEIRGQSVSPNILMTVLKKVAPIHSVLTGLESNSSILLSNLETFVPMDMTQMAMKQRLAILFKSANEIPIISLDAIHVLNRALNNLTYYLMDSLLSTPLPAPFQNPAMLLTPDHIAALVSQNADLSIVSQVAKWNDIFENIANSNNIPISPPMTDKSCSPENRYSSLSCDTYEISADKDHDHIGKSVLVSPPCSSILPSDSSPYRATGPVTNPSLSTGSKNTSVSPKNTIKKPYVKSTDLRINTNLKQRPDSILKQYSTKPSSPSKTPSLVPEHNSKMTGPSPNTLLKGIMRTTPSRQSPRGINHVRLQLPQEPMLQRTHATSKQAKSADTYSPPHRLTKFKDRVLGFVRRRSLTSEETNDMHPGGAVESLESVIEEEKEPMPPPPQSLGELTRSELEVLVRQLHADVIASRLEAERARKAELMIQAQFDLLAPRVMMKIRTMEQSVADLEYVCDERRYQASKLKAELDQVLHYMGYVQ